MPDFKKHVSPIEELQNLHMYDSNLLGNSYHKSIQKLSVPDRFKKADTHRKRGAHSIKPMHQPSIDKAFKFGMPTPIYRR